MCGIAGFVHIDGRPADRSILDRMCDAIVHRGPDGQGAMTEGPVALGMRRLAIIDVAGGNQPIRNETGRTSIVFNGEAYNFQAVRADLESRGHVFKTHSDTEAALHAYEEHGADCGRVLRGMFAFAIWDDERRRLTLVRDRLGKKPLFYYHDAGVFIFGSEIKTILVALARFGRPRPRPLGEAIVQYMGYGYIADPLTAFEGIRRLPPGCSLTLENGRTTIRPYWTLSFKERPRQSEAECLLELERILDESVRLRMISEVPLGAYLSGGVDSSTVCALMARASSRPIKTFSIGFENEAFNELEYARKVAAHLGTEHHEFTVKADAASIIDGLVRHFDEPFADSSAIPTYYVSKIAREHVTVALSGDGGDELFAGYSRYRKSKAGILGALPLFLRRILFGLPASLLPAGAFGQAALDALALDDDERYVHHLTVGVSAWHRELFTDAFARSVPSTDPSPVYLDILRKHKDLDATTRRMAADVARYLTADVMVKVDRMSMMVSLEARAPLLDHEFVEFAAGLPLDMKVRNGESKWLLKKLARKLVPAEVIDRKKQGFAIPVSQWFNDAWMKEADDLLIGPEARRRGIIRPSTVDRLLREHRTGRRDQSHLLWALMMLELWFRRYA